MGLHLWIDVFLRYLRDWVFWEVDVGWFGQCEWFGGGFGGEGGADKVVDGLDAGVSWAGVELTVRRRGTCFGFGCRLRI